MRGTLSQYTELAVTPMTGCTKKPVSCSGAAAAAHSPQLFPQPVRYTSQCPALTLNKNEILSIWWKNSDMLLCSPVEVVMASVWLGVDGPMRACSLGPKEQGFRQCLWVPWEGAVSGWKIEALCPTPLLPKPSDSVFFPPGCGIAQKVTQTQLAMFVQEKAAVTLDCTYDTGDVDHYIFWYKQFSSGVMISLIHQYSYSQQKCHRRSLLIEFPEDKQNY